MSMSTTLINRWKPNSSHMNYKRRPTYMYLSCLCWRLSAELYPHSVTTPHWWQAGIAYRHNNINKPGTVLPSNGGIQERHHATEIQRCRKRANLKMRSVYMLQHRFLSHASSIFLQSHSKSYPQILPHRILCQASSILLRPLSASF